MMDWYVVWLLAAIVLWIMSIAMIFSANGGGVVVNLLAGICLCASIVMYWDLAQLERCEKELPRTERCKMVAVPESVGG